MSEPTDLIRRVGEIVDDLGALGLEPVLVGGMALVVLGSRRVTRDFDFVVARPGDRLAPVVARLYDRGLELVSGFDAVGDVATTITNRRVAIARLRLDEPVNASFFHPKAGLRLDLLFDFPIAAATLAETATRITVRSHAFAVASVDDLLRLKRIASAARQVPGDAIDIAFLEALATGAE